MKIKFWKSVLLLTMVLSLVSCDDNDDGPSDQFDSSDLVSLQSTVETGDWRITLFVDEDDYTARYNGFVFTFNSNGTIVAENGSDTFNGSWRLELDDDDDFDYDNLEFYITFSTVNSDLNELTDDWYVSEFNNDRFRLIDDNDNFDDETLTFERF